MARARVRALHPDFGLFWPSPRLLRKLSIAIAVIAIGAIAGSKGIQLLYSDEEYDAGSAFAYARPEPRVPVAVPESPMPVTAIRQMAANRETGIRVLPSPMPMPSVAQPSRPEPKVIRVQRRPITVFEPSRAEAKPATMEPPKPATVERKPATVERVVALPVAAHPNTKTPATEAAIVPVEPPILPDMASAPVAPPVVSQPPRASRRASYNGSDSDSGSRTYSGSRSSYSGSRQAEHSHGNSYRSSARSGGGGYAGLW